MKLKLENGTEYHVRFSHGTEAIVGNNKPIYTRQYTTASVSFPDSNQVTATAYCNPSDQFNKAKGRKLALARAIESLPRAERGQIWAAYFAATGGVK